MGRICSLAADFVVTKGLGAASALLSAIFFKLG
jgi:hypothetical protein